MNSKPNTLKIIFFAPSAYPLGGVQTWLDYLLPGLEQHNCHTTLALTSSPHHNVSKYLDVHKVDNVEVIDIGTGTAQSRVESIEKLLLKIRADIAVVVNIADVYQAVNNLRGQNNFNIKLVSSLHGIDHCFFAGIRNNNKIIDAVVSTNRLTEKLVNQSSGLDKARSLYAPYGVDLAVRPKAKRTSPPLVLAYVGRFDESQKRFKDAVAIFNKALNELDELKIILAGGGPSLSVFENWLQRNPKFKERVEYLGVIKAEEVVDEVYRKADALLLTSQWETGPIVAWEAMSQEVSFISSRYDGHKEEQSLVHNKNCLLFDIGDIDNAVECIKTIDDSPKRKEINQYALDLVTNKYTIEISIQSWLTCFKEVLELKERPFSHQSIYKHDHGRLTDTAFRFFGLNGLRFLEKIRRKFKVNLIHNSAGSEWPHQYKNKYSKSISKLLNFNTGDKR